LLVFHFPLIKSRYPWNSSPVISSFIVSGVGFASFILVENYSSNPLIPLHLFENRNFVLSLADSFLIGWVTIGTVYYIPVFFQKAQNETPTLSGIKMFSMMFGLVCFSIITGIVISKTGKYTMFPAIGSAVMTMAMGIMTLWNLNVSSGQEEGSILILGMISFHFLGENSHECVL
jgi:hypothetical protein